MGNKVFISHSSSDYRYKNGEHKGEVIQGNPISKIIKTLRDNDIDFFIDESGLLSGKGWSKQLADEIDRCNIFLYISSYNSNCSSNTADEVTYAIESKKHIIPFKIDNSPFHSDNKLQLIRLHYLRYYEDKDNALKALIKTINGINTPVVLSHASVALNDCIQEDTTSDKILLIFQSSNLVDVVKTFKDIINEYPCKSESGYDKLSQLINKLEVISKETNAEIQRISEMNLIVSIRDLISNGCQRHVKLFGMLLEMFLFYVISDMNNVSKTQKEVEGIKFERSFFEKNADNINDIANMGVRAVTFIGGVAAMFTGKGGSAGKALMLSSTRGEAINVVKTVKEINEQEKLFSKLKTIIVNLKFE